MACIGSCVCSHVDFGINCEGHPLIFIAIVNLKYAVNYCIYGYENEHQTAANVACSNQCSGAGDSMHLALIDRLHNVNTSSRYAYCYKRNNIERALQKNVASCIDCLQSVPSSRGLIRYLEVLKAACEQRPRIKGTKPVELKQPLFQGVIDVPTTSSNVSATNAPTATAAPNSGSKNFKTTLGLGLGLSLGLGLPLFIIFAGASWYVLRRTNVRGSILVSLRPGSDLYEVHGHGAPLEKMSRESHAELGVDQDTVMEISGSATARVTESSNSSSPNPQFHQTMTSSNNWI